MSRPAKVADDAVGSGLVEAFRRAGFAGATTRALASATGLKSASLYHRFAGGKEDMARAALDQVGGGFVELVLRPLDDLDPAAALARSADGVRRFYDDGRLACLLAVFALSDAPEPVGQDVAAAFDGWRDALAGALGRAGVPASTAEAEDRIAAVQGALVIARATGRRDAFDRAVAAMASAS